ncbi:cytochrome P450 enzyme phantom [Leptinotarsa decemlineata]|uniref:cytochrome P450 enzyme phantom n=1 Tax=Leptinotarsa decemlineata TaxID=7539 RepID=UPI003D309A93
MVLVVLILVTALTLLVTYYIYKRRGLPPGPWGLPIIGFLPWLDPIAPYLTLTKLSKKYGSIYGLSLGNVYAVVLTDPKIIKSLFSNDSTTGRAPLYLTHGIMKGYGLICAEGELWREQRRFVHNCIRQFGGSKIGPQRTKMEKLIMTHANEFVNYIGNSGEDTALDPLEPLRHSLGSAINLFVFGISWSRNDDIWIWLQEIQEEGTKHIGVAGPLNFLPFLRFLPKYQRTMKFLLDGKHKTHELYQKIIDEQVGDLDSDKSATNILQAFLLEKTRKSEEIVNRFYNDQQFYHLLADLFGAGLDTTLTTLRWYLMYLAKNKSIQENIRSEINDVLQGRPPTLEDMPHLPLLEASICEAQRIRPVVPVGIPHGTMAELVIEGYRIPKGTMIVPLQWAMHMNEEVWNDPEKFDPYRFLDDEGKVVKNAHFMPFQIGKRMCVGDELARMILFLFVTTIIQNFSFVLENEEVDFSGECGITLTPKSHKIKFSKIMK